MRIGYVIWSLGLGGAEQVVMRLAVACARRGHTVIIYTLNAPGVFAEEMRRHGIPVVAVGKRSRYDLSVLWRLQRAFADDRLDVVHTHLWTANVWGRIAARMARVPVVIATEHNVDTWKPALFFLCDRWLVRWTTQLVAVSQEVRAFYERHGVGRGRWRVIYNGVDAADTPPRGRAAIMREFGIGDEEPVVGWIGRLVPAKAPEVFVEAMAMAMRDVPSMKALIVGDGPLRRDVDAHVRRLGLEARVILTGLRQDVPALLAGMDALVFSSEREGLSMAMLEAMAAGVPVVATRVGGTPELIESGVTGLLVPPQDPASLAREITGLLASPARAAKIRQTAREHVERQFSLQAMVDAHETVYAPPLRVCYVIDDLGFGGAQRQLVELVKALPRARYAAHVISLSSTRLGYAQTIRDAGIPLTTIEQRGAWSWSALRSLVRVVRAERPTVIHTWLFTADLYGRIAARLARVPIVVSTVRSVEPDKPAHYVAADRLLRFITDAFAVNARAVGEVLARRERVPPSKIHTIYNGVDLSALDPTRVNGMLRQRLGIADGVPLVGIVGRLAPEKDHETFLRAAALVARERSDAQFLVVGDGPLRAALESLARELRLAPAVRFLHHESPVASVFSALDVLVVSSRYEGCCNVILEAMAMATPVIATAVGGNPELVTPGQTGWLVPVGDPTRLAEVMLRALREPAPSRMAMGRAARRQIEERFSLERMVGETTGVYERLLAQQRTRPRHQLTAFGREPSGGVNRDRWAGCRPTRGGRAGATGSARGAPR